MGQLVGQGTIGSQKLVITTCWYWWWRPQWLWITTCWYWWWWWWQQRWWWLRYDIIQCTDFWQFLCYHWHQEWESTQSIIVWANSKITTSCLQNHSSLCCKLSQSMHTLRKFKWDAIEMVYSKYKVDCTHWEYVERGFIGFPARSNKI